MNMNYLHLRYLVTIARLGSLTKASQELMIAQPNLSRIIQGMENTLGVILFTRSSKGVSLTPEGKRFISKAQQILAEIDDLEQMFADIPKQRSFSVSIPGVIYLTDAFARFSSGMGKEAAEYTCHVTDNQETIQNLLDNRCDLGIIRYASRDEQHYRTLLEEKHLSRELIADYIGSVLVSNRSPLAQLHSLTQQDLSDYIEITWKDSPFSEEPHTDLSALSGQRIYLSDCAAQFDVLCQNPRTYLWTSPIPQHILLQNQLQMIPCPDSLEVCRDLLIYRSDYRLSDLDKQFITEIVQTKRRMMPH